MLLKKRSDPKTFDRINFLMDHVEVKEKKIKRIIPILKTAINQVN